MAKTQDFTKYMNDMLGMMPMDAHAMGEAFKSQAAYAEKLSKVALGAAEQSAEITHKFTRETLSKMAPVTSVKDEPADYTKAMTDFASAYAEVAAENMAAFAEVAKKVQMDTVEIMMAAGKEAQEDATAAVKKATAETTAATKKAAAK
ncbi:Phasin [Jannaschia ovalis]|uniref:Phasin n=1 Tax=Jannaschia ovalis TaxID=3038773 RepID=A0ABY8LEP6_9RHOB|nr:Phasin [Jannaschia sp. GRR-S6-38]WGH79112.1 Phasin [Jannaschia sp. GRR-S6-38]